jgi:tripartite-type tricarboxylate transporter receptor subunit TctC
MFGETIMRITDHPLAALAGALAALGIANAAHAQSGAEFFKGKTLTYVVATAAGGGYDTYARLITEYMQKHLPGVTIVVKNMPGAGHLIGANFIYSARPDGLTIGTFNTGLIYTQLIGRDGMKLDLKKMSWVGKASSDPRVMIVSANNQTIKTFDDLLGKGEAAKIAVSGVGAGNYNETQMLMHALGLNIKPIAGYNGNEDQMAMRRSEVDLGFGSDSAFETFTKNGYGRTLFAIGGQDPSVPQLRTLVKNPTKEASDIIALIGSQGEIARLTAGPPEIPADRLTALRDAYKASFEDPQFKQQAAKLSLPLDPAYGEDVAKLVKAALDQSPETVKLVTKILSTKK